MLDYIRKHIWGHLPTRVTDRQRVMAAVAWGIFLPVMIGGISWYKNSTDPEPWNLMIWLLIPGIVLSLLLLIPATGVAVYVWVIRVFAIFGFFLGRIILTVFFYCGVTPLALLMRATGRDPLERDMKSPPVWHKHHGRDDPRRYYRLS